MTAVGVYVHVPFCEAKCTYCHFAIDPRRPGEDRQERYLRALLLEMETVDAVTADTLYFGGGTPSLMAPGRIALAIDLARTRFSLDPAAEVTLEANPRDLDVGAYRALRRAGVNRLSLGVQSLDDGVLREMGRFHTGADALAAVDLARRGGIDNVSVDLILGWPGETRPRWERTVDGVAAFGPDHVSLYVLEVEGKTLLSHQADRGRVRLPDEDLVADLYRSTADRLATAGLERYEISNFARPGRESRHNGKYWDDLPFLGFGMSAHSYRDGRRWWNRGSYGGYCQAMESAGRAVAGERVLGPRERIGEALFTGLRRRHGIDLPAFRARYGVDPLREYSDALQDSFEAGLVEVVAERLRLTEPGVLLSNEVFRAFV